MEINSGHLVSLMVTMAIVIVLGVYAAGKIKSADDFSIGGRSSGVVIVSGTIVGTIIGGAATMGTAQMAYCVGFSAWWFTLGSGLGLIIMALFYARPLRSTGLETIPQYLVLHYGKTAGPITSVASSIGIFFSIVASMLTAINLLATIFGVPAWMATVGTVLIVVVYVIFGGIQGTGLAGIFKVGLIYVTLFVAGITAFTAMDGLQGFKQTFPDYPWFSLFGSGLWTDLGSAMSLIVGVLSTQTYVQAVFAGRDTRTAIIGTLVAALITIPVGLPSVAVGMYMRIHYPDILPINALPLYIIYNMPAWLGGVAITALILSAIGSVAGLALGVGTMISRDIFNGFLKISGNKSLLWLNRASVLIVTLCAAVFAFGNLQSLVLEWNYLSMALRGTGIFVPLTMAVFFPEKLKATGAIGSMIAGISTSLIWIIAFPSDNNPLFLGLAFSLGVARIAIKGNCYQKVIYFK